MKEEREEKKMIDARKRKKEVRLAAELLRLQCITAEHRQQGREAHAHQEPPWILWCNIAIGPVSCDRGSNAMEAFSVISFHPTWAKASDLSTLV